MSLLTNIQNAILSSTVPIDQILGTYTGSFASPSPAAPGLPVLSSAVITTNIPETTFFKGIFSTDGGTTWNDFNAQTPIYAGGLTLQTVQVYGKSAVGSFTVYSSNAWIGSVNNVVVLYKVVIFAKPNQGNVTPQPFGTNTVFDSRLNYQKIAVDNVLSVTEAAFGSGSYTTAHNLGYVPKVRGYLEYAVGATYSLSTGVGLYDIGYITQSDTLQSVTMDTVNVTVNHNNSGNAVPNVFTLYTRIYYDA
jgi:hypothetical protein